jgi:sodium/bile acid cotransporter 7
MMVLWFEICQAGFSLSEEDKKNRIYRMYREYKLDFPDVADMTPSQAARLLRQGHVIFVDARSQAERKVSMLPGAVSKSVYLSHPNRYRGKKIVSYCTIGYRSGIFAKEMGLKGVRIYNLKAGLLGWIYAGGRIYDSRGETRRVHVYGEKWDLVPEGYQSIKFGFFEKILN